MALTAEQQDYLYQNYKTQSHKQMALAIDLPEATVRKFCSRKGLRKIGVDPDVASGAEPLVNVDKKDELTTNEKFNQIFCSKSHYKTLQRAYSQEELDYYLEEFYEYLKEVESQGGVLTSSEKRAVDQLIQTQIALSRTAARERELMDYINELGTTKAKLPYFDQLADIHKEMKDQRESLEKQQKALGVTRDQRLKVRSDAKISIITILAEMKEVKNRNAISQFATLEERALVKCLRHLREIGVLEDDEAAMKANVITANELPKVEADDGQKDIEDNSNT